MEQSNPGRVVLLVKFSIFVALDDEEECLGEPKEANGVDNRECEHVSSDHLEDHGHKRPGQLDRSTEEHEVEPGDKVCEVMSGDKENEKIKPAARNCEDQHGFFYVAVIFFFFPQLENPATEFFLNAKQTSST